MITGLVLVGCWAAMFDSSLYRWTYTTWWFFGTLTTGALTLLTATLIMGIVCRRNFGKNLDHYCELSTYVTYCKFNLKKSLNSSYTTVRVQSALSSSGFTHSHFDKCEKLDDAPTPGDPDCFWEKGKTKRFSYGSEYSEDSEGYEKSIYNINDSLDEQVGYIDVPLV